MRCCARLTHEVAKRIIRVSARDLIARQFVHDLRVAGRIIGIYQMVSSHTSDSLRRAIAITIVEIRHTRFWSASCPHFPTDTPLLPVPALPNRRLSQRFQAGSFLS